MKADINFRQLKLSVITEYNQRKVLSLDLVHLPDSMYAL